MFTLNEVREVIKDKPEFRLVERDFGFVVDYAVEFEETFKGKTDRESEILINLRGTCFYPDGKISRLMWHKFKNMGQSEEYSPDKFDLFESHRIEEKIDGSCIAPIIFPFGNWELGTRAGVTDVSKKATNFLKSLESTNPKKYGQYISLINGCLSMDITPIFEYVGRDQRIVIDYPETKLIFTGARCMVSG